ncbi:YicC/YloC family endoribonuclease [Fusobacterium mortiferum]|uniref:YicC/YloC family endoribonuclease n=1 Tax=Fusobacterium mortiferum TaxID=850 RepID=UPI00158D3A4B|nr:YicC/YloC family endoribonuclease [Fusobacterium mortiferum]
MRSMTGYSKLSYQDDKYALNMELKSVNNKNLNLKIKLPYNLNFLEGAIRTEIASKVSRGSLDLKIEFSDLRDLGKLFDYDKEQSKGYMNVLLEMEKDFNEKFSNKMDILVRNLNVIKKNDFEIDEEEYTNFILGKIKELLTPFIKTREEEGERLRIYFLERISVLEANIDEIKKYKDQVVEIYKNKLLERLDKIKGNIEFKEEDILKEILLFTDKSDISEEISRLDSHMEQLKKELSLKGAAVGKKIDFILQEIYRELNTTGVKSNLYEISKLIVECKNELEKIREQSMNIE